jgi:hypothetical protein
MRDFRLPPEVAENCALLSCYAASSGNFLPKFHDNLSVPSLGFKYPDPDDRTNRFSRNVGKKSPLHVA